MNWLLVLASFLLIALPATAKVIEAMPHSKDLPPLDAGYRPGAKFLESKPEPKPENVQQWYKIPNWLAGTWESKHSALKYQYNYRTKKEWQRSNDFSYYHAQERFGKQMDRAGNIWDLPIVPVINKAISKENISYHNIVGIEWLYVGNDHVMLRVRSIVTQVSRVTSQIVSAYQQEAISIREPAADNLIRVQDSIKVFDIEGRPIRKSRVEAMAYKVKPFEPVNERGSIDVRELFNQFLKSQNMQDLLPENSQ